MKKQNLEGKIKENTRMDKKRESEEGMLTSYHYFLDTVVISPRKIIIKDKKYKQFRIVTQAYTGAGGDATYTVAYAFLGPKNIKSFQKSLKNTHFSYGEIYEGRRGYHKSKDYYILFKREDEYDCRLESHIEMVYKLKRLIKKISKDKRKW